MKILYHHRIAARDGMDVHKSELIKAFRALGHEVIEVGPEAQQKAEFGSDGGLADLLRRHLPQWATEALELVYDRLAWRRLKRAYLKHRPDILYERHNLYLSAGMRLKKKYGLPFLLEVNAPLAEERERNGGLALKKIAHAQEGEVWRAADAIFPVTEVLAGYLTAKGVNPARIRVVPNAVDPMVFNTDVDGSEVRRTYALEGAVVLGFTGFIRDWHGLDKVIEALPALAEEADVHLLVVGDGPAKPNLEAQAETLSVAARVHFTGIISRSEIPAYVAAFDIALQPAVTPYASPLKLFEYLALGKPVLAPDQPNIREIESGLIHLFGESPDAAFPDQITGLRALVRRVAQDPGSATSDYAGTWQKNAEAVLTASEERGGTNP